MKFALFAAATISAVAPIVAAQNDVSNRLANVDQCQRQCLGDALKARGCGETDVACGCEDGNFIQITVDMAGCILDGCNIEDIADIGASVCAGAIETAIQSAIPSVDVTSIISRASETLKNLIPSITSTINKDDNDDDEAAAPQITPMVWAGAAAAAMAVLAL